MLLLNKVTPLLPLFLSLSFLSLLCLFLYFSPTSLSSSLSLYSSLSLSLTLSSFLCCSLHLSFSLLLFTYFSAERCKDYDGQTSLSVLGDAALLNCTLASVNVFNYSVTPYNISWYEKTGRQLAGDTGRIQVRGSMLWVMNTTLEDAGYYQCVLRYVFGGFFRRVWTLKGWDI